MAELKIRRNALEQLESRVLLAGDVSASVVDGVLHVDGDDASNVFEVRQLSSQGDDSSVNSFLITPDSSTSVNGLAPGTPVELRDVVGGLRISPNGGDDAVRLVGSPTGQVSSVSISCGEGEDSVSLESVSIKSRLQLFNSGGLAKFSVLSSSVSGALTLDSPSASTSLHVSSSSAQSTTLRFSSDSSKASDSSLRMSDVSLDGSLQVSSGSGTRIRVNRFEAARASFTISPPDLPDDTSDWEFSDVALDGPLFVSSGASLDLSVRGLLAQRVSLAVRDQSSSSSSSLSVADVDLDGRLDVVCSDEGSLLLQRVRASSLDLRVSDIGDSSSSSIELSDVDIDNRVSLFTKGVSSLQVSSLHASSVVVSSRSSGSGSPQYDFGMSDVVLDERLDVLSEGEGDFSLHRVSAGDASVRFSSRGLPTGKRQHRAALSDVNVDGRLSVACAGELVLSASRVSTSSMSVHVSNVDKEPVPSSVHLSDVDVSSGLSVLTDIGDDSVSVARLSSLGSVSVRTGDGDDSVVFDEVLRAQSIFVRCGSGEDSLHGTDLWVSASSAAPRALDVSSTETVVLSDLQVHGETRLDGGGSGLVTIQGASFRGTNDQPPLETLVDVRGASQVDVFRCDSEGAVRVRVSEKGEVRLTDVLVSPQANKATPDLLLDVSGGVSTELQDVRVDGGVSLYGGGGGGGVVRLDGVSVRSSSGDGETPDYLLHVRQCATIDISSTDVEGPVRLRSTGQGDVRVRDFSVTKPLDKASPLLMLDVDGGANTELIDGRVTGAVSVRGSGSGGAVFVYRTTISAPEDHDLSELLDVSDSKSLVISSTDVDGPVRLRASDQGSVRVSDVTLTKEIDKATPILMLDVAGSSSTHLLDVRADGAVSVYGSGGAGSSVVVDGTSVRGWIDKSSPDLMLHVRGSESVEISSSDFDGPVRLRGTGTGELRLSDVIVTKELDKSTPLMLDVGSCVSCVMDDVHVDGPASVQGSGGGSVHLENVSLSDRMEPVAPDLMLYVRGTDSVDISRSSVAGAVRVRGTGNGDVSVRDTVISSDSLSTSVHEALSVSGAISCSLSDSRVDGAVDLDVDGGSIDVSFSSISGVAPLSSSSPMLYLRNAADVHLDEVDVSGEVRLRGTDQGSASIQGLTVTGDSDPTSSLAVALHVSRFPAVACADGRLAGDVSVDQSLSAAAQDFSSALSLSGLHSSVVFDRCVIDGSLDLDGDSTLLFDFVLDESSEPGEFVLAAPSRSVSLSDTDVGGDFRVDSFFDISYAVDSSRWSPNSSLRLSDASSVLVCDDLRVEGDFNVDSFFDVFYDLGEDAAGQIPPNVSAVRPAFSSACVRCVVGGSLSVDSEVRSHGTSPLYEASSNTGSSVLFEDASVSGDLSSSSVHEFEGALDQNADLHRVVMNRVDVGGDLRTTNTVDLNDLSSGTPVSSSTRLSSVQVQGELYVRQSVFTSPDFKIEIDGLPCSTAFTLEDSTVGTLTISNRGASSDSVLLRSSHVTDETRLRLDDADDFLSCVDSVFTGDTVFDGGDEVTEDSLSLSFCVFRFDPLVLDFERFDDDDDGDGLP